MEESVLEKAMRVYATRRAQFYEDAAHYERLYLDPLLSKELERDTYQWVMTELLESGEHEHALPLERSPAWPLVRARCRELDRLVDRNHPYSFPRPTQYVARAVDGVVRALRKKNPQMEFFVRGTELLVRIGQ